MEKELVMGLLQQVKVLEFSQVMGQLQQEQVMGQLQQEQVMELLLELILGMELELQL